LMDATAGTLQDIIARLKIRYRDRLIIIVDQAFENEDDLHEFVEPTHHLGNDVVLALSPHPTRQCELFSDRSNLHLFHKPFNVKDVYKFLQRKGYLADGKPRP